MEFDLKREIADVSFLKQKIKETQGLISFMEDLLKRKEKVIQKAKEK